MPSPRKTKSMSRALVTVAILLLSTGSAAADPFFTFDSDLEGWNTGTTDDGWGTAEWRDFCGSDRPAGCVKLDGVGGPGVPNAWIFKTIEIPSTATVLEFETTAHNRDGADSLYRVRLVDAGGIEHILVPWTVTAGEEADVYLWEKVTVPISEFAGQQVTFFFEQDDNGPGSHEQRYYDNIRIPDVCSIPCTAGGAVYGMASVDGVPSAGIKVVGKNKTTLERFVTRTDENGCYKLQSLTEGDYKMKARTKVNGVVRKTKSFMYIEPATCNDLDFDL